jgi:NAD(P) transhydrogenase subunit alpha
MPTPTSSRAWRRPTDAELDALRPGTIVIGVLAPLGDAPSVERYAQRKLTALSMDIIPRTTKAQAMDVLSSQANIAGYKAVLIAAEHLPKYFPDAHHRRGHGQAGQGARARRRCRRAAGDRDRAPPRCRRVGYDVRAAVKEQVQSLGANFLEIDVGESAEGSGGYAKELSRRSDRQTARRNGQGDRRRRCVITTAAVPGRRAPLLVTAEAVAAMKPGSVVSSTSPPRPAGIAS